MWHSWEWICDIHESGYVTFTRVDMWHSREWICDIYESGHVTFMRVDMWHSWEWICDIHESGYVTFMRVDTFQGKRSQEELVWDSWGCLCEIYDGYYEFFYKIEIIKNIMNNPRERSCEIYESGCLLRKRSHYVVRAHVKFIKVIIIFFYKIKIIKVIIKNSGEWSYEIHESGHMKFMKVVVWNSIVPKRLAEIQAVYFLLN